jgi:hypothetical protein
LILDMSELYQPFRKDREQFGLSADMSSYTFTRTRIVEFNRLTLGNDIAIDYRGLRVRNELVYLRTVYTAGKRDAPSEARGGFMPDSHKYNWSILVAYRVWQIEPYARNEFFFSSPTEMTATYIVSPGLGVNVYFRPNVILKVAWTHPRFYMDDDPDKTAARQNFHTFSGILTCAF